MRVPAPSKVPRRTHAGFTLFEVVLALAILMMISGAVFGISAAALEAAKTTREEQLASRRLEGFLRITRDTLLGLDAKGSVSLRIDTQSGSAPIPELVFERTAGAFGVPSLAGGSLVLAALPQADGARTFSLRRIPREDGRPVRQEIPWTPLLAGVEQVKWSFFSQGQWLDEWQQGQGRPEMVRLTFRYAGLPGYPIESIFWLPPLAQTADTNRPGPRPPPPPTP